MFISTAYAQAGGGGGGSDFLIQLMPLVLIFVIFWFLLIRPQQKKAKDHRAMVAALRRGDQVVTSGGIMGRVTKVIDDSTVQVEIAENVRVRCARGMITEVLSRGEPARGGAKKEDDKGGDGQSGQGGRKPLFSFGSKK